MRLYTKRHDRLNRPMKYRNFKVANSNPLCEHNMFEILACSRLIIVVKRSV